MIETILRRIFILFGKMFHFQLSEERMDALVQFVKFGLVGVSNTVISYVSYAILVFAGCHYLVASVISFVVSVLNSYYWNNRYVFAQKEGESRSVWQTLLKTFISYAFTGLFLNNILLVIWVDVLEISEYIAPLINLIVSIPVNYLMNKYWAFKTKRGEDTK